MLIGLGSDLHARPKDNDVKILAVEEWLQGMQSQGCEWGVFLGDWFDSEQIGDRFTSAKEILEPYLNLLNKYQIPILLLAGNHDTEACKLLGSSPWVRVVSAPGRYRLGPRGELYVLAWPWGRSGDYWGPVQAMGNVLAQELEALQVEARLAGGVTTIFCAHIGQEGAMCPTGHPYPTDPISCLMEGDLDNILQCCDDAFLGHVHTPLQNCYVGPMALSNHGEENQNTGWILYDTETRCQKYIQIVSGPVWATIPADKFDPSQWGRIDRLRIQGPVDPAIRSQFPWLTVQLDRQQQHTRRFQETLETGDMLKLALQWCRFTEQEPPDQKTQDIFQRFAQEVSAEAGEETFCPIDRLLCVKLKNIGRRHRDTEWEFNPQEKTTALCGPIGTGKTLILESLYMALWGAWMTPRRSLENMADPQGVPPTVQVDFQARGQVYSVTRGPGHLRVLVDGQPITKSNKVKENEPWLAARFPKDSIRDILVPQRAGVLLEDGEAAIMTYMSKVLRLEVWDKLGLLAEKHLNSLKNVEYQAEQLPGWVAQQTTARHNIAQVDYQLVTARNTMGPMQVRLLEVQQIMKGSERLQEIDKELSQCTIWLQQSEEEYRHLGGRRLELEHLNTLVNQVEPARALLQEAVQVLANRAQALEEIRILEPVAGRWEQAGCRANPIPCPLIGSAQEAWSRVQVARSNELAATARWVQIQQEFQPYLQSFSLLGLRESLQGPQQVLVLLDQAIQRVTNGVQEITAREEALARKKESWIARRDVLQAEATSISGAREEALSVQEEQLGLVRQISATQEQVKFQTMQITAAQQQVDQLEKQIQQVQGAVEDRRRFLWIQQACSRNGIRQMLIEDALPGLQTILDDLCGGPMEGRFWLSVKTTKELKNKEQRESFQILYEEEGISHDAIACSGGQLAQVKGIWAAAMLMWQQRTATHRLLLLDEITAGMDADACELFMRLLNEQVRAEQILIVTHTREVAERCDGRIFTHGV